MMDVVMGRNDVQDDWNVVVLFLIEHFIVEMHNIDTRTHKSFTGNVSLRPPSLVLSWAKWAELE